MRPLKSKSRLIASCRRSASGERVSCTTCSATLWNANCCVVASSYAGFLFFSFSHFIHSDEQPSLYKETSIKTTSQGMEVLLRCWQITQSILGSLFSASFTATGFFNKTVTDCRALVEQRGLQSTNINTNCYTAELREKQQEGGWSTRERKKHSTHLKHEKILRSFP